MPSQTQTKKKDERQWWEKARDGLVNSVSKPGGLLRYVQVNEKGLILNTDNIANDFEYEVKRLTNSPDTDYARTTGKTEGSRSSRLVDYVTSNPVMQTIVPGGVDLNTNARSSTFQAVGNAVKAVEDFEKPFGPKGDGLTLEEEGEIDAVAESSYASSGKTPRSQMTEEEVAIDDFKASAALNIYLAVATGGLGSTLQGIKGLQQYPRIQQLLNSTNFAGATSKMQAVRRFALAQFLGEIPSTYLDDNTGGSGIQLGALIAGLAGNQELAQQISEADPVKPGMSRMEASNAAFFPNLGTAGVVGTGLVGAGQLGKLALNYINNPPARARAQRSQAARAARQEARSTLENEGVIQTDETGKSTFTEEAYTPSREGMTAEEQFREANGIPQEPAADATPTPPGLDELPDPSLPEVDGLVETVEANVSDAGLDQIIEKGKTGSVVEAADEVVQAERSAPLNDEITAELVEAPADNLVLKEDLSERYTSVPTAQLESLVRNSPELSAEVTKISGKTTPDQFTRTDILNALKSLEATDGVAVMPSRLMGQQLMAVDDIVVAPEKFQFKQNVDPKTGQQKGNSLDGVQKYNEDAEGAIQVWEDLKDGKVYVVNGHNRLALAKKKGINSMRVEFINANSVEEARAKGALANIASGGGTPADAAKFFRESGITELSQLEELGLPMKSGFATKGFALSRLPGNIFQDFVDGRLSEVKALALGDSGLDEAGMQQAYKALNGKDLTDGQFNEVLQQAKSAPTVEGSQVDLFGNTETLNLMVDKAKLANAVRQGLSTQKRAAKSAASNAATLEGAGNQINKEGSLSLADDTAALLEKFDADKYMETDISKMLNEGAQQIADGGKVKPIADRIRRQLLEMAEAMEAPAKVAEPEVVVPAPQPRRKKLAQIAKAAAQKGEVRPPQTPLPQTPDPGPISRSDDPIEQILETTENELRLSDEFEPIDNAVAADQLEAKRESMGYDMMTFEQKKQNGLLDGLEEPARQIQELQRRNAAQQAASKQAFKLPADVAKSKPRFGMAQLQFASDLDRAAYIIRNKAKASKGEARIIKALEDQGYDIAEIRARGDEVKNLIQDVIEEQTGSRRAPQEALILEIPDTDAPGIRASVAPGEPTRGYSEKRIRQQLQSLAERKKSDQAAQVMDLGTRIPRDVAERAMVSEAIAAEMVSGLKEAARISGADPLRIQYLDEIRMDKLFGEKEELDTLALWSPDRARFARENPNDPLNEFARGRGSFEGLNVPFNYPSIHRGMIYLAMGPALNNRLARPGLNRRGGLPLSRTMYHEAFHSVQTWLDAMGKRSDGAGAQLMNRALNSSQAIEEMTALIKKDRFSSYAEGMDNVEIQAEAFASWYLDRSVRLKSPGLQGAFERIKKFVNTLRRKWKYAMEKDPSWVDVFELAADGQIADKGNQRIAKLTDQQLERLKGRIDSDMDAALPGLTERVEGYLKQKQEEFDLLNEQLRIEADVEGC